MEGGVNRIGTEDLATTHFERGIHPETVGFKGFKTIVSKNLNKETWMHLTGKTVAYISGIFRKTNNHKVLAAAGIICLVLLVLMLLMKPAGTKVKEAVSPKSMNSVDFKQENKAKTPLVKSKGIKEEPDIGQGVKHEMVLIPAGNFMIRDPGGDYEVTLTIPFYMGKYEVTQEHYESVMGNNPSNTKGAKLPVTDVSWNDCQEFIRKLNAKTNAGYRLPTEAEWEYSCRAGTTTSYSFGDKITPQDSNYVDSKIGKSVAVGSYKPNAFGLYDMHGNVFEWCDDWYGEYPAGAVTDPKGLAAGERRVLRGGSFAYPDSSARSSSRQHYESPIFRNANLGFRLARTP